MAILHSEDPLVFYATLSHPTEVIKTGFLMASLILGDSMIVSGRIDIPLQICGC